MKFKIEQYERCETMNSGSIEDHLIGITKPSIDRMLKMENPSDCIALYTFYCYTRKWQKNSAVFATSEFAMKALSWGRDKFSKAKTQLKDAGFIEDIQRKDESGKIVGWFVGVSFAQSATLGNFHTTEIPYCGKPSDKYLGMVNEIPSNGTKMQKENSAMASSSTNDKTSNGFQTSELFNQQPPAANPPKGRKPKVQKPVDAEFLAELQKLNPDKDVEREAKHAQTWLLSNPGRPYSRKFLANWVIRSKNVVDQNPYRQSF